MLRASLSDTYEIKCREKEEDLMVLRREMLEAVTKFSTDKEHWEREIEQKNYELHDEKVNNWLDYRASCFCWNIIIVCIISKNLNYDNFIIKFIFFRRYTQLKCNH